MSNVAVIAKGKIDYDKVYEQAIEAFKIGFEGAVPVPMVVGSPTHVLGSDVDPNKQMYFVADGVCGSASLHIADGRHPLARYFRNKGLGFKNYYGGYDIPDFQFGGIRSQSLARNEGGIWAVVKVYAEAGIQDVYGQSRID